MSSLYLAWQDAKSRGWFPVGRLTRHETEPVEYAFEYVRGAENLTQHGRPFVVPIPGFPDLKKGYRAPIVFPAFRYRAMNLSRPDRPEYLSWLGLSPEHADLVDELAVSGGHSVADQFEIFPAIEPDCDGRFETRFVLHGLSYTNEDSVRRTGALKKGDRLEIVLELNNPVTVHGLAVKTADHYFIGWLPRYLVDVFHSDHAWQVEDVRAVVAQVNRNAPLSHRVLVDFSGRLPPGVDPIRDLEMYQPIATGITETEDV